MLASDAVQITLTKEEAGHLLSAVGHYRQFTDGVIGKARGYGHPEGSEIMDNLQAICRAMDRVAEQLLSQD